MIWSSPPMLAITALMSGSAKAAWMSAARSSGAAPIVRVVGYSTTFRPKSSWSRRTPKYDPPAHTTGTDISGTHVG